MRLSAKPRSTRLSLVAVGDGDLAGASLFLLVLSFNLLGDGLCDALDPRHK